MAKTARSFRQISFILIILFVFATVAGSVNAETNINTPVNTEEQNNLVSDLLVNANNKTFNPTKIIFVYYDRNTTEWKGCYGLNYTVLTDEYNNEFLLDHAETDILGNATDYTFRYPGGISILYENNTELSNQTGYYYVYEIRSDNGTVIKSSAKDTFNDKSHMADFIPSEWVYLYSDEDQSGTYLTSEYKGDILLRGAYTNNTIGPEKDVFFPEKFVIGLMCYANGDMDLYKYGFNKESLNLGNDGHTVGYSSARFICLSNNTTVRAFNIETEDLTEKQKSYITNYDERVNEVRERQMTTDIINAIDDADDNQQRVMINSRPKASYGRYYSPYGGYGYGYSRYYYG